MILSQDFINNFKKSLQEKRPMSLGELFGLYDIWKEIFISATMGNQEMYLLARDTRSWFEESKWVRV